MGKVLLSMPLLSVFVLIAASGSSVAAAEEPVTLASWLVPIFVITGLIILNGLYVASEFAIIGTRPSQMEALANNGNQVAGEILTTIESPREQDRYIATAQLGITIASLGLGMYAEPAIAHLIEPYLEQIGITNPHTFTYILVLSGLTFLHVVVGEMVPKAIALSDAAHTAIRVSGAMRASQLILTPLVVGLNSIGNLLLRLLQLPPAAPRVHSPEEIELIVTESAEGGLLNEEEEEIIRNIFDFSDRRVRQVMTPRPRVQAIAVDMTYDEIIQLVASSNHTRFPVYIDDRDHIIGILHMRDLVEFALKNQEKFNLRQLMSLAPAVPEDQLVEELLTTFKAERIHMAIVLDGGGGMAGVVTLEDLVEEVVGEVRDEFDIEKEPLVELEPGLIEVAGDFLVEDLDDLAIFAHEESLPDVETVGGLIVTKLGRPPQRGDIVTYDDMVEIEVLAIDGLAVTRARISFNPHQSPHDDHSSDSPDEAAH